MCVDADLPNRLMRGEWPEGRSYERDIDPPRAGLAWFCLQLIAIGDGREPDRTLTGPQAVEAYAANEATTAAALTGR
jgi:hypothetical protein